MYSEKEEKIQKKGSYWPQQHLRVRDETQPGRGCEAICWYPNCKRKTKLKKKFCPKHVFLNLSLDLLKAID